MRSGRVRVTLHGYHLCSGPEQGTLSPCRSANSNPNPCRVWGAKDVAMLCYTCYGHALLWLLSLLLTTHDSRLTTHDSLRTLTTNQEACSRGATPTPTPNPNPTPDPHQERVHEAEELPLPLPLPLPRTLPRTPNQERVHEAEERLVEHRKALEEERTNHRAKVYAAQGSNLRLAGPSRRATSTCELETAPQP